MPIHAIILDVGGVLVHERDHTKRYEWEARLGLARGALTPLVMASELAQYAASGAVAQRAVWEAVGAQFGLTAVQIEQLQHDFWACEQLDTQFVQLLQTLHPRYKLGVLSNAWSGARTSHNAKFKFHEWVDAAVYSSEVKLLKPDPQIYRLMLAALDVTATECVFVDDKLANVQAAQALGMCGVWYRDTAQTIADIQACLSDGH